MRRFYMCPVCGLFERNYDVPDHRHWLGDCWATVPVQEISSVDYFERQMGCETCPTCGMACPTARVMTEEVIPEPQDLETYGRFK